jgi:predicted transcriptional regulator
MTVGSERSEAIYIQTLISVLFEEDLKGLIMVKFLLSKNVIVLTPNDNLHTVIEKIVIKDNDEIPVVDFHNKRQVVGKIIKMRCHKFLQQGSVKDLLINKRFTL